MILFIVFFINSNVVIASENGTSGNYSKVSGCNDGNCFFDHD